MPARPRRARARVRTSATCGGASSPPDPPRHRRGRRSTCPATARASDEAFSLDAAIDAIDDALPGHDASARAASSARRAEPRRLPRDRVRGEASGMIDGLVAASCGDTTPGAPALGGLPASRLLIGRLPDRGRALNDPMARLFLAGRGRRGRARRAASPSTSWRPCSARRRPRPRGGARAHRRAGVVRERPLRPLPDRGATDAARRTRGRLVVVPGATHLVSLARPDDFTAVVLGAVAELECAQARRAGGASDASP